MFVRAQTKGPALRALLLFAAAQVLCGCQAPYLLKSAWSQADLLRRREPLERSLQSESLKPEEKAKLRLAREAKIFAENELGLKRTSNYESFVQLDSPYVSYVVSAAPKDKLEHHNWSFPIVGSIPYKGYFAPGEAKAEAEVLKTEGFDTYVRGVSAYSTLGWFDDPVLSSMLRYSDYDLVNTIIHETVHATLYIKSEADFNERLATFIGNFGADMFFRSREGAESSTLKKAAMENEDEAAFNSFISGEITALENWYKDHTLAQPDFLNARSERFKQLSTKFEKELRPKLKSERMIKNLTRDLQADQLNNARILTWRLYVHDLGDFERAYTKLGRDPLKFIAFAKSLEKADDPVSAMKQAGL